MRSSWKNSDEELTGNDINFITLVDLYTYIWSISLLSKIINSIGNGRVGIKLPTVEVRFSLLTHVAYILRAWRRSKKKKKKSQQELSK